MCNSNKSALIDGGSDDDDFLDDAQSNDKKAQREKSMARIHDMIVKEEWGSLLSFDELNRELAAGRALNGFTALQPSFPPTFKRKRQNQIAESPNPAAFSRGVDAKTWVLSGEKDNANFSRNFYDAKRLPSYTDRILYKSLPGFKANLKPLAFKSIESCISSDHKPVKGLFELSLTKGTADILTPVHGHHHSQDIVLSIDNLKGKDLAEMDTAAFGGGSDPYIVAFSNPKGIINKRRSTLKSSIIKHNLNPEWKDKMDIALHSPDIAGLSRNAHIFLSVWDYDMFNEDDLIGVCALPLNDILAAAQKGQPYIFNEDLTDRGIVQGGLSGKITAHIPVEAAKICASLDVNDRAGLLDSEPHRTGLPLPSTRQAPLGKESFTTLQNRLNSQKPHALGCGCVIS